MAMTSGAMARRSTDAHAMIERIGVSAFTIPTDAPESDGTRERTSTTLVALQPVAGALHPDLSRPDIGLEFKRADAERYAI